MKKRRDLKTWSKRNVPDDLLFEILTRLPVKSVLRFRCVARSWLSMIDDPRFARLHLTRFNNNRLESHLFVVQGYRKAESVVRFSKTLRTTDRRFRFHETDDLATYNVVSSIYGLFMLTRVIPWGFQEFVLWNPSIGNIRYLPPLPIINSETKCFDFGLGFDPLIQDYKYVTFVLGRSTRNHVEFIAVYTVGTGSWKTIEFQGEEWRDRFIFAYPQKSLCLKGVLYSIAIDQTVGHFKLVSFDLKTEVFDSARLPNKDVVQDTHYYYHFEALTLIDGGHSLALVAMSMPNGSIWVSDCIGGDDVNRFSWSQRHTFPTVFPQYEYIPVMFLYVRKIGEDELLLRAHNVVISYNLKTHVWIKRGHIWRARYYIGGDDINSLGWVLGSLI